MKKSRVSVNEFNVKIAKQDPMKKKIFHLRYTIYVQDMGLNLLSADHTNQLIFDELDEHSYLLYFTIDKELVGTTRVTIGSLDSFSPFLRQSFLMQQFSQCLDGNNVVGFSSKLMVSKAYRSSAVAYHLIAAGYKIYREHNVKFIFCGCSPYMIALYEQMGFQRYAPAFSVPEYGCMIPLVLLSEDKDHLKLVRSPFQRIARNYPNDQTSYEWFYSRFPKHQIINSQLISWDAFYTHASAKLAKPLAQALWIFSGLNSSDLKFLFQSPLILNCRKGDQIAFPNDVISEIFIVLSGTLEIRDQESSRILTPGSIVGEDGVLYKHMRNHSLVAATDSDILILPLPTIERIQRTHPDIVDQLIANVARKQNNQLILANTNSRRIK